MKREITSFFKKENIKITDTLSKECQLNEFTSPEPTSVEIKEFTLTSEWSNSIFKFLDICEYISRFNSTMHIKFTQDGIDIVGMDCTHVARINIHLDKKDCMIYQFKQDEREFFINFEDLAKKLKRFSRREDTISIKLTLEDLIYFQSRDIHFYQKNLHTQIQIPPIPNIQLKNTCTAKLNDLIEILEFANDHTSFIYLKAGNNLRIEGICDEDETEFHKAIKIKDVKLGEFTNNKYIIKYLLEILRITKAKISDHLSVFLEFSNEMPLHIIMKFSMNSFFQAYLDTCLEDDGEMEEKEKKMNKLVVKNGIE